MRFKRCFAVLVILGASVSPGLASGSTEEQNPTPPQQTIDAPSQARARAYAKVLEGQRHLVHFRGDSQTEVTALARQAFQDAAKLDPTLAEAHTALAQIAFYYPPQDLDAAGVEGSNATRIDPNNFGAHQILARLYTIKSGLREGTLNDAFATLAIKELKEVARLDKNNAESWALLGELYDATKRNAEALDAWTRWATAPQSSDTRFFEYITNSELSPDAASARLAIGLLDAKRWSEALLSARRAVAAEPANRNYLLLLNRAYEADGSRDVETVSELQRIVAANPANTLAAQVLAEIESRRGNWQEAVKLLKAQLKGTAADFSTHLAISGAYSQGGQTQEAIESARKALELAPPAEQRMVTTALLVLSSAQEQAGDIQSAEESLRRILAKEPNNATALNNLGYFLTERNQRLPEALEMIQRAVKAEPANASFLDSLGWVYFKLGQFREAEENLTQAARGNASSATIQEHLGEVYHARNEVNKARAAWEKALSLSVEPAQTARLKARLNTKAN